jgi:hypothetical protein
MLKGYAVVLAPSISKSVSSLVRGDVANDIRLGCDINVLLRRFWIVTINEYTVIEYSPPLLSI